MNYGRELPGMPYNAKAFLTRCVLFGTRAFFGRFVPSARINPLPVGLSPEATNAEIRRLIETDRPFMMARFGGIELEAVMRCYYIEQPGSKFRKVLRMANGSGGPFWWDNTIKAGVCWNAGFFPPNEELLAKYSHLTREDSRQLDLLASYPWANGEKILSEKYFPDVKVCNLRSIEPFFYEHPWSYALKDRRVLVVHPFANTIKSQYARRENLFANRETLPEFSLTAYRSVSSMAGATTEFADWFEALDKMKSDIAKLEFDTAIIGCGAYGFSLAAFIKRDLHRQAIHLGGVTQALFGIKGVRWDHEPKFANGLYNENWVRPFDSDKAPGKLATIEGGCYW